MRHEGCERELDKVPDSRNSTQFGTEACARKECDFSHERINGSDSDALNAARQRALAMFSVDEFSSIQTAPSD